MRLTNTIVVLLLVVTAITLATAAKNGKKKKKGRGSKKPPVWKPMSMPLQGKKFLFLDEGQSMILDCRAKGKPKPRVTWYHNGQLLEENDLIQMKKSGELSMEGVLADKSGNYTCMVENSQGNLDWTFLVKVQEKIMSLILDGPHNVTSAVGTSAKFICRVLNDPQAEIRWFKGEKENRIFLPPGDSKEMLSLDYVTKGDEGVYGCQASNVWTTKAKEAFLTVIEPRPTPRTTDPSVTFVPWYTDNFGPDLYPTHRDHGAFYTTKPSDRDQGGPYDTDMFFTTKRPRNRNGGRKNKKDKKNRNKHKKNKHKTTSETKYDLNTEKDIIFPMVTMTLEPMKTTPPIVPEMGEEDTTRPLIWGFNNNKGSEEEKGQPDDRTQPKKTDMEEKGKTAGSQDDKDQEKEIEGSISSWTIYTVVGAVGGVILLIGLVAITLTLCLRRDEGGVYKSTPV